MGGDRILSLLIGLPEGASASTQVNMVRGGHHDGGGSAKLDRVGWLAEDGAGGPLRCSTCLATAVQLLP